MDTPAPDTPDPDPGPYSIVRFYRAGGRRVIRRGLTRAQAEAHCSDPETSSTTATGHRALARTARVGDWFDGFTSEPIKTRRWTR